MYGIDAAIRIALADQLDQLIGGAPDARHVLQSRGHAEGFVLHPLPDQLAHLRNLARCSGPLVIVLHDDAAHCSVSDQKSRIGSARQPLISSPLFRERPWRRAIRTHPDGRNPLAHQPRTTPTASIW